MSRLACSCLAILPQAQRSDRPSIFKQPYRIDVETGSGVITADGEMELLEMPTVAGSEEGRIEFGVTRWHVQSVNRIAGGRGPAGIVGYEIRRDDEVIAAVEIMNSGRVWMSPSLTATEQDRVATWQWRYSCTTRRRQTSRVSLREKKNKSRA